MDFAVFLATGTTPAERCVGILQTEDRLPHIGEAIVVGRPGHQSGYRVVDVYTMMREVETREMGLHVTGYHVIVESKREILKGWEELPQG